MREEKLYQGEIVSDREIPIFRSLEIIEERIREKLTVEKLAENAHFSRFHYQRLFRETVGESVMRYVARRRLTLAAEELVTTEASVLQIALKYGYDSHEGFTRSFRAYMGVTPTEYRKYHLLCGSPQMRKEEYGVKYSKVTGEILRELNSLTVQARETAAYVRKYRGAEPGELPFYTQFWDFCADRAEGMADALSHTLEQIDSLARRPDEITSRFLIIKAIEDTVFWTQITAFQIRLTIARAQPEHGKLYEHLCEKFDALSQNAHIKAEKTIKFFSELSALIFQDIRNHAREKIQVTVAQGRAAAKALCEDTALSCGYIGEETAAIAQELEAAALEEMTVSQLEDYLFRLDIILLAAETDMLRTPSCRQLIQGIGDFKKQVQELLIFIRELSEDTVKQLGEVPDDNIQERSVEKRWKDIAFQGNILLFYLKGEVQKLGSLQLEEDQKSALNTVCKKMEETIFQLHQEAKKGNPEETPKSLEHICSEIDRQADRLGICGAPIGFIADEIRRMAEQLYR